MKQSPAEYLYFRLLTGILMGVLCVAMPGPGHAKQEQGIRKTETVRIGIGRQIPSALALIAADKGFFSDKGFQIQVRFYPSGKSALQAMIQGKIDAALGVAEVPFVLQSFENADLVLLCSLGGSDRAKKIIARKSAGISAPKDLAGKRIATQEASAVHFFLHIFLAYHGITEDEVKLSFMAPEELPEALAKGTIDAFSMREPFLSQARNRIGSDAVIFELPGAYFSFESMVSTRPYVQAHPAIIRKIMQALYKAEVLIQKNPGTARQSTAHVLNLPVQSIEAEWRDHVFGLSLSQSFLIIMEDAARWAIQRGYTQARRVPNFIDRMDPAFLEEIKPNQKAVTLVR